jgi:hypothetical protein
MSRSGYCVVEGHIDVNAMYTIILSTFRPAMLGKFVGSIRTSMPGAACGIVPTEGFGKHTQNILGDWSIAQGTAAGCANHGRYRSNPIYGIAIDQPVVLTVRLCVVNSNSLPINLSLFQIAE